MALENEEQEVVFDAPTGSWNELAEQQRLNEEQAQMNANRKAFNQYIAIEDGAKQQKLALDHQRAIAGAAMIQSAFRNGGMSDRSLSAAFSQAFGRQIYGGQLVGGMNIGNGPETVFTMYGAAKDPQTGKATIAPVAMMGTREMLQVLKRAGLGDATNAIQDSLINNSYLGKLTDDQRAAMGVSRPSAPITTGGTEISAAGVRALRGLPRPRSSVSSYYSDGAGGEVRTYSGPETGYQNVREASGTFSPDYQGRWKVLESNGDGQRYANDRTGEEIFVPKGDTLRNVLQRGGSERERIARIQAQGRENAAQIQAQGRAEEQAERKRQFDETLAANKEAKREQMRSQFVGNAVQNITKMLKDSGVAEDKIGDMVQTQLSAMLDQYDKAMGWGNEAKDPAPKGDGTIVGAAGGATGGGGKGGAAQDSNEVRAALLAEKEKRAAKSQGASGGKADGNPPAQKDRGDNNGKQTTISERRKKEYDDGMKEIHAKAEKMKNDVGWSGMKKSAKDIETYIKREEYMLKERLRKKYNNIQGAMK